jgi:hypothetical protein
MSTRARLASISLVVYLVGTSLPLPADPPGIPRPVIPMAFVENRGQWPEDVRFATIGGDRLAGFRRDGIAIVAGPLELTFEGARSAVSIDGEGKPTGLYTFIHGRDRSLWRSGVPGYGSILYQGLYDCIDLRVREGPPEGGCRTVEYDLVLEPGADPRAIAIRCDGAESLALEEDGSLLIVTARGAAPGSRTRSYSTVRHPPSGGPSRTRRSMQS